MIRLLIIISLLSFTAPAFAQKFKESRRLVLDSSDFKIIQEADSLLSAPMKWNRQDDRECADDMASGKYSLYCALYKASMDVTGTFEHRRAALEEVRLMVEKYNNGSIKQHRLMDWNNSPKTSFADLKNVLKESMDKVRKQLNKNEYWIEY